MSEGGRASAETSNGTDVAPHRVVLGNLPWIATLVLFALLLVKLLTVADFNTNTALALARTASLVNMSLGIFSTGLSAVLYLAWIAIYSLTILSEKGSVGRAVLLAMSFFVGLLLMWAGYLLYLILVPVLFDFTLDGRLTKWLQSRMKTQDHLAGAVDEVRSRLETEAEVITRRLKSAEDLDRMEQAQELSAISDLIVELKERSEEEVTLLEEEADRRMADATTQIQRYGRQLNRWIFFTLAIAAVGAMVPFLNSTPWLPLERLVFEDGSRHIGYVLEEAEGNIVFMTDAERRIEMFKSSQVSDQLLCVNRVPPSGILAVLFQPPAAIFFDEPDYPLCSPQKSDTAHPT